MKEADIDDLRVQSTKEEVGKVCDQLLDLFELNQIPSMMAVLGMWNVMLMTFKVKFNMPWDHFEKAMLNMIQESKSAWKDD